MTRRLLERASSIVAAALMAGGCAADDAGADGTVVVFAASSLTDVLEAIEVPGAELDVAVAGSPTLVAQLREGASADVLVTADRAAMDQAIADGSVAGPPTVVATNTLELVVADGNPGAVDGLDDLADSELRIGLCAADVPCGTLALTATASLGVEVAADTEEPSVRALAAKVGLGEIDAALVYRSDALALGLTTVPVPDLAGHVTEYLAATVAADPTPEATGLVDALAADSDVRRLFADSGFGPPPS